MLSNEVSVILVLIFTCILFLLGVFLFLLFKKFYSKIQKQQQEALKNLIIGQENERYRFSRDIHDKLSPEISNIKIMIDRLSPSSEVDKTIIKNSKQKIDQISERLRNISHDLFPKDLANYNFAEVMEDLLHQPKLENLKSKFESNCYETSFPNNVKSHLYSILQELLQNTLKHSSATKVEVNLFLIEGLLHFKYEDNGIGFSLNANETNGIGLKNITTRVQLINGEIYLDTSDKFKLTIIIKMNGVEN